MMKLISDDMVLRLNKPSWINWSYYEERRRSSKNRKYQEWRIW